MEAFKIFYGIRKKGNHSGGSLEFYVYLKKIKYGDLVNYMTDCQDRENGGRSPSLNLFGKLIFLPKHFCEEGIAEVQNIFICFTLCY